MSRTENISLIWLLLIFFSRGQLIKSANDLAQANIRQLNSSPHTYSQVFVQQTTCLTKFAKHILILKKVLGIKWALKHYTPSLEIHTRHKSL